MGRGKDRFQGPEIPTTGCVLELAQTEDGALVAWVDGSVRYTTKVDTDADGMPNSICTCPYGLNCETLVTRLRRQIRDIGAKIPPGTGGELQLA